MAENKASKIKSLRPIVRTALEKYDKSLRDSDEKLVARVWTLQLEAKGVDVRKITAVQLLQHLINKDLSDPEDISRCRRGLQANDESLRGETFETRNGMGKDVRKNINKEVVDEGR